MVDKAEFACVAEKYKDTVFRVALNYLGSMDDADDMVQEVLLKLYVSGKRFNGEDHIKRWLIRVTLNLCNNAVRSRKRQSETPVEELTVAIPFKEEEDIALFSAVMALPERYRTPLYLFYYEEYSAREIGELLHLRETAVTTRLSRARSMLKAALTEEADYGL